jgi:hypothetical protein
MGGIICLILIFSFEQMNRSCFNGIARVFVEGELRLRQNWMLPCVMAIRGNSTG